MCFEQLADGAEYSFTIGKLFQSFVDDCTKAKSPIKKFIDYIIMNNYTSKKLQIAYLNGSVTLPS